jgi:hypothetical protein
MTTPRHLVNAAVLTCYDIERRVNSKCGSSCVRRPCNDIYNYQDATVFNLQTSTLRSSQQEWRAVNTCKALTMTNADTSGWLQPDYLQPLTLRWYNSDSEHVRRSSTTIVVTRNLVNVTLLTHFIVVMMWRGSTRGEWMYVRSQRQVNHQK